MGGGKVRARGKVWPKGEPEPAAWTIERIDPIGSLKGSAGHLRRRAVAGRRRVGDLLRQHQGVSGTRNDGIRCMRNARRCRQHHDRHCCRSLAAASARSRLVARLGSRQRRLADVGRHARPQHGLEHEGPADDLGRQDEEERQVGGRARLADLRQPGRRRRHTCFVGTNNEAMKDPEHQGRQGHPDGVPRVGRPVPVAGGARQARGRPRQRLAVPGHLLVAAGRERHRLLRVEPRRADGGRPRRLPRQDRTTAWSRTRS